MERDDVRVLSVLVTWLGVHHARINADRLARLVTQFQSARVHAFWAAVAHWLHKDRRFTKLRVCHRGTRVDLLRTGTEFHVKRHGEDPRFANGPLCVPGNMLRDRANDVATPEELAKRHATYRYRVLMGPSYRADMWAELERNAQISAAELARRAYGSFATAWDVKKDWSVLAV